MLPLTLGEVAAACGGRLASPDPNIEVRRVCTDSRCVQPGDLFVALRGENFDGDAYAAAALAGGAAAVVVRAETAAALPPAAARIVVDDGLRALQDLASAVRRRCGVKVVGITGSAGKTSTKDILAALLRPVARTVATSANLNNEIGVPLTLLEIEPDTEVAVVEMAMRGAGQIRELARVALPDVGVITNIAPVHLELVGTIEDVAAAKAELVEELTDGTAVVPADERLLDRHVRRHRGRVVTFGAPDADVHVVEEERRGESTHVLLDAFGHRARMDFSFTGGHYLSDALAAVAAFVELGYRLDQAAEGAAQVAFSDLRGALSALPGGGLLLNDAYNANPVAMKAAVDHLVAIADGRPDRGRARRHVRAGPGRRHVPPRRRRALRRQRRTARRRRRPRARLPHGRSRRDAGSRPWTSVWRRCPRRSPPAAPSWSRPRASCAWSAWPRRSPTKRRLVLRAMGASVLAMVLVLVIGPAFIRWLRLNEFGQNIREEGPEGHKTKEGTPTMGGVLIWFAVLIPYLIFSRFSVASLTVFIAAIGNAGIGFADDWIKIVRKRSLGLSARYKLLLQLLLSLFIGFVALRFVGVTTSVDVPFTSYQLELGTIGFYALIFLTLAGFSNAVNLTDGLDGLAAGASAIVLVALAGIAFIIGRNTSDPGITDLMVIAGCVGGAALGFLWYNTFPADVFMGDTGSLGLGGAIAGMAVMTRTELVLVILGGLFVIEAGSVAAQVISFKLFHRRVLLMAPLHHHFELKAWSETKIIVRFWIIAAIFAGAGFAAYYATF